MRLSGIAQVRQSLDRLIGQVGALAKTLDEQGAALARLSERVAQLEQDVQSTRGVVEAFAAAKGSMRFLKWIAGPLAAFAAMAAALKGWLHR